MHFFNTNCLYLFHKASTTINLFLFERLQHFKPSSLSKSTQKLHKSYKQCFFLCFCQFRSEFDAFFNTNCFYLFEETSTTTHLFLTERPQHSKPPSFSKSTQKLQKFFKNLIFLYFCQFRSEFDAFFKHQ